MTRAQIEQLVIEKARACGLDERIAHSQISVESSFNPRAVGPMTRYGTAKGLAQFIDDTARRYGVRDPFDPYQALDGYCAYMTDLLRMFGADYRLALAGYHSGEGAARAALNNCKGNPNTCNYVATILSRAGRSDTFPSGPVGGTGGNVATPSNTSQPQPTMTTTTKYALGAIAFVLIAVALSK